MVWTLKNCRVTAGLSYHRGCMMTTDIKEGTQGAIGSPDYDDWLASDSRRNKVTRIL